ncbi:MAG: Type 1 glutamine amidotransferase-like domain-containing protein [bacterium]|nr:Type 1 glutamine amidotransferase-like domain-containing protein [bacterium]
MDSNWEGVGKQEFPVSENTKNRGFLEASRQLAESARNPCLGTKKYMKKLFLSSAGVVPETQKDFLNLIGRDPQGLLVAFIPTAAYPELDKSYVKSAVDQIESLGMIVRQVDLVGENQDSLYQKLKDVDIIWVNGGNTFFLLDQIRKSGFDQIIDGLLDDGKIYVGLSAGSYVACPTNEAAKWKHIDDTEVVKLNNLSALSLVDFLIIAHYEDKYEDAVRTGAKTTKYPVVALTDKQAVVVRGKLCTIVGTGSKFTLNNFKETV